MSKTLNVQFTISEFEKRHNPGRDFNHLVNHQKEKALRDLGFEFAKANAVEQIEYEYIHKFTGRVIRLKGEDAVDLELYNPLREIRTYELKE